MAKTPPPFLPKAKPGEKAPKAPAPKGGCKKPKC